MRFERIEKYSFLDLVFERFYFGLTADQKDYFSHINDFDPIVFYVIDGKYIATVDDITGDVLDLAEAAIVYKSSIEIYNTMEKAGD